MTKDSTEEINSNMSPRVHVEGNKIKIVFKRKAPSEQDDAPSETVPKKPCIKQVKLPLCSKCHTGRLHGVDICIQCQEQFQPLSITAPADPDASGLDEGVDIDSVDYRYSTSIITGYRKLLAMKAGTDLGAAEGCSNPQSPDGRESPGGRPVGPGGWAAALARALTPGGGRGAGALSALDGAGARAVYAHVVGVRAEHFHAYLRAPLQRLLQHPLNRGVFNRPVDPVALGLPTYREVVRRPLDLGTVKTRLLRFEYPGVAAFAADVRLVFANALAFNPAGHPVAKAARALGGEFEAELARAADKVRRDHARAGRHACGRCAGRSCGLCGDKCLRLEPPLVTCTGRCRGRVKRGALYYVSSEGLVWCQKCYSSIGSSKTSSHETEDASEFSDTGSVMSSATPVAKKDLVKKIHDSEVFEEWVQCTSCKNRFHEMCVLFNSRKRAAVGAGTLAYHCPFCRVGQLFGGPPAAAAAAATAAAAGAAAPEEEEGAGAGAGSGAGGRGARAARLSARALPAAALDRFLEAKVRRRLRELGHGGGVQASVTVRTVADADRTFAVPGELRQFFPQVADTLTYTSKCVMMFQEVDGVDVCIFSMYVQEYGPDAPGPNRGAVYVAYLDSVEFFRPRPARTAVYQELVLAYLAWAARAQGRRRAYIWACPPQRGNSFIFWCHPPHQRTPSKERLLRWYGSIVARGREMGVVAGSTNLYAAHFKALSQRAAAHLSSPAGAPCAGAKGSRRAKGAKGAKAGSKAGSKAGTKGAKKGPAAAVPAPATVPAPTAAVANACAVASQVGVAAGGRPPLPKPPAAGGLKAGASGAGGDAAPVAPSSMPPLRLAPPEGGAAPLTPAEQLARWAKGLRGVRCPPIKRDEGEGAGAGALGYACPPVFDGDFWVEQIVKIADRQQKTLRAPPATPGAACSRIAAKLLAHKEAGPFLRPVDPVALNIPDYFTVIARPMDLGTVAANLAAGQYLSVNDFVQDMALVFGNAKRYNPPGHFVHQLALKLERLFDKELRALAWRLKAEGPQDVDFLATPLGPEVGAAGAAGAGGAQGAAAAARRGAGGAAGQEALRVHTTVHLLCKTVEKMKEDFLVLDLASGPTMYGEDLQAGSPAAAAARAQSPPPPGRPRSRSSSFDFGGGGRLPAAKSAPRAAVVAAAAAAAAAAGAGAPAAEEAGTAELLENRQNFLEMCQYNGYQFDTLRRAKFSSTMLLYHLLHEGGAAPQGSRCPACGDRVPAAHSHKCPAAFPAACGGGAAAAAPQAPRPPPHPSPSPGDEEEEQAAAALDEAFLDAKAEEGMGMDGATLEELDEIPILML